MQCSRCNAEAIITQTYSGVSLCSKHLVMDIEAKVKREIRKSGKIARNERIYLPPESTVYAYAVRTFLKKLLIKRKDVMFVSDLNNATLQISAACLEDTAEKILYNVCLGTQYEVIKENKESIKTFSPFSVIPRYEVYLYAQIHGQYKLQEDNLVFQDTLMNDIHEFISSYVKSHPSTLYALKGVSDQLPRIYQESKRL